MFQQTFHNAMTHWNAYFKLKKGLPANTQKIYWDELEHFSDEAMRVTTKYVPKHFEFFPKLVQLLPLMEQMEKRHGPKKGFEDGSRDVRDDWFGDWSKRNLRAEALGWYALLHSLKQTRFRDAEAVDRVVEHGNRYKADLDQGLRKTGLVAQDSKDPVADVCANWEYRHGFIVKKMDEIETRVGVGDLKHVSEVVPAAITPEPENAEDLPF